LYGIYIYLNSGCIGLFIKLNMFFNFTNQYNLYLPIINNCTFLQIILKITDLLVNITTINFVKLDGWIEKFNSSKNVLNEDLDNYEWFSLLRSEVDLSKNLPTDLSIKYGNAYLNSFVDNNINKGRQLYYRGLNQEIKFQIPISGTL
jgi:hypothetical protein